VCPSRWTVSVVLGLRLEPAVDLSPVARPWIVRRKERQADGPNAALDHATTSGSINRDRAERAKGARHAHRDLARRDRVGRHRGPASLAPLRAGSGALTDVEVRSSCTRGCVGCNPDRTLAHHTERTPEAAIRRITRHRPKAQQHRSGALFVGVHRRANVYKLSCGARLAKPAVRAAHLFSS